MPHAGLLRAGLGEETYVRRRRELDAPNHTHSHPRRAWLLRGLALVAEASAGDFADGACTGDATKVCPVATTGQSYSVEFTLKEPGDACPTFAVTSGALPPGLSLASDEGVARGTPTQAGSYTFYVTVRIRVEWEARGRVFSDQQFTINVNRGRRTASCADGRRHDGVVAGRERQPAVHVAGPDGDRRDGDVVDARGGTLPAGLTLGANGVITGTPTQSGTFAIKVQANASGGSATKDLSLFVLAPLGIQTLVDKTPPETGLTAKRLVGQALATGVKAVGGRGPYTFSTEGDVPPGITVDPALGTITGSGTTAGRYAFTVTVTDATGTKASVPWNITILPLLDFTKGKGLPIAHVSKRYSARIPVKGKDSATAEFAIAGKIPPGLEVDDGAGSSGRC